MGFFRQFKDSFTNFNTYRDISVQRTGKTFKFFFILFTLIFIIQGIQTARGFNAGIADFSATVKEKVPEFKLANGKLTVEGKQPIVTVGENNTALIIDTTGQLDETALDKYNEGVFISRDKIVSKQNFQTREIAFASLKQFSFDKQQLIGMLPLLKWLLLVLGILAYIFGGAWALITTVILALIGLAINSNMKGKLTFGNTWNMAVYALSLPLLIELVKNLVYPAMPMFWPIKWGLAVFLMYKAIEAVVKNDTPEPPAPHDILV